ncbi:hypothetical protein F5Y03DRAFT_397609 [Xylaria venustula]|nr:hypothetical protein F5Y03DRAFT_397609 [Xylaria venustula]
MPSRPPNVSNIKGHGNKSFQDGRSHTSDIIGDRNLASQLDESNTQSIKGNSNFTIQNGKAQRSTTVHNENLTGQKGTGNLSDIVGMNNYTIQYGDENEHTAHFDKTRVEVAGTRSQTSARMSGERISQYAPAWLERTLNNFKQWIESHIEDLIHMATR